MCIPRLSFSINKKSTNKTNQSQHCYFDLHFCLYLSFGKISLRRHNITRRITHWTESDDSFVRIQHNFTKLNKMPQNLQLFLHWQLCIYKHRKHGQGRSIIIIIYFYVFYQKVSNVSWSPIKYLPGEVWKDVLFSHAEVDAVNKMKNLHGSTKRCALWSANSLCYNSRRAVSLCQQGIWITSGAVRWQPVFAQVVPARERQKTRVEG